MGFRKTWDVDQIRCQIGACAVEAGSPYNDGWTASSCKYDLYVLKCYLDDIYSRLPTFADEKEWEQQRVVDILSRK